MTLLELLKDCQTLLSHIVAGGISNLTPEQALRLGMISANIYQAVEKIEQQENNHDQK